VDNFQLGAIMVTATPKLGELKELSSVNKVEDLKKALGDLKDASTKLVDGSKKLSDGVNLASSKLQDGMKQLNSEENKKKLCKFFHP
jgi:putative membrane protein